MTATAARIVVLKSGVRRGHRCLTFGTAALALMLVGFYLYADYVNPGPFYRAYDPEMQYLLSSLSTFKGFPYIYIDHPGTPIEMLGTALLALTYPFVKASGEPFVTYHLTHPDVFLSFAHALLTAANVIAVALLARYAVPIERWPDVLSALAVAAFPYALHPQAFSSTVLWSHNSLNLSLGSLLLLGLWCALRSGTALRATRYLPLAFGAGALTAVQLYFATWIVGTIATIAVLHLLHTRRWLRTARLCLSMLVASGVGFVVATFPIRKQYPAFAMWVASLVLHQGRYGSGPSGITSVGQLSSSMKQLAHELPELFVVLVIVIALVVWGVLVQRRDDAQRASVRAAALGLLLQLLVTLLLIFKHPAPIYMLSIAAVIPLLFAVSVTALRSSGQLVQVGCAIFSGAVLIGALQGIKTAVAEHAALVSLLQEESAATEHFLREYAATNGRDRESLHLLWTYGTDARCHTLWFANTYANGAFREELARLCPHDRELNIWNRQVQLPTGGSAPPSKAPHWDLIVTGEDLLVGYRFLTDYGVPVASAAPTAHYGRVVFIPHLSDR